MVNARLVNVGAESNVTALVQQLYVFPKSGASKLTDDAVRAVTEANPHLADLETIAAGVPLVVPDVPGLARANPSQPSPPAGDFAGLAASAIDEMRSSLKDAQARAAADARLTLETLQSRDFLAAAKEAGLTDQIDAISKGSEALLAAAERDAVQTARDLDEFAAGLRLLLQTAGQSDAG